ncbi:methyltransferase [Burkholderia cenocepacia]|uniref:methyltransferase n=1 Tax=Burkholderia cenocepacia TaxID=95486 RepID=UPI001365A78B|nr:methyltransferase [Burkholderia cenocepacia]
MSTKAPAANLRFRRAKNASELLGQVPTPSIIGSRLLEGLPAGCKRIVDLGAGDGRLAYLALARCPEARALLIETDEERVQVLEDERSDRTEVLSLDVMRAPELLDLRNTFGAIDAVVSNPPYLAVRLEQADIDRIQSIFPFVDDAAGWVRSDVAFAAYAWSLTTRGGFVALILPAPAITQAQYRPLREKLVSQLNGLTVTQLPSRCFPGVEVDAFLVTGTRAVTRRRRARLRLLNTAGDVVGSLRVSYEAALSRLDFNFHEADARLGLRAAASTDTLESLGVEIIRGSLCRTEFAKAGLNSFHTTDFSEDGALVTLSGASAKHRVAQTGDILIPRVGSRCLTKEARVMAGAGVFSDCVYRLRASPEVAARVWNTLNSEFGRQWRAMHAEGSCAKHLPLWVLKGMPVQ